MTAYQLVADTETIAADQLTGTSTSADIATYNTDLAAASDLTAGC